MLSLSSWLLPISAPLSLIPVLCKMKAKKMQKKCINSMLAAHAFIANASLKLADINISIDTLASPYAMIMPPQIPSHKRSHSTHTFLTPPYCSSSLFMLFSLLWGFKSVSFLLGWGVIVRNFLKGGFFELMGTTLHCFLS